MKKETLFARIKEITDKMWGINEDGGMEIYVDYRDELSDSTIKEIMESDNPSEKFDETLSEWAMDYAIEYGEKELEKDIKKELTEAELECWEENKTEVTDFLREYYYFYYPADHFNKDVCVNIMIDTGDMNYDFTCNNVLNYYGRGCNGEFDQNSSILWLAKTQKKATKLRKACEHQYRDDGWYVDREKESDKFIESVIQELENATSHMNALTFLVKIPLFKLFELKEIMNAEKELNNSYHAEERKGTGYIVLDKKTMCGLFDTWSGSGSVLEIELDNDVKLPIKFIFDAWVDGCKSHGYDIGDVYGMCESAWKETLKEIHSMEGEVTV